MDGPAPPGGDGDPAGLSRGRPEEGEPVNDAPFSLIRSCSSSHILCSAPEITLCSGARCELGAEPPTLRVGKLAFWKCPTLFCPRQSNPAPETGS